MANPINAKNPGAHSIPGLSCKRCKRPLPPDERTIQDGDVVCVDCVYRHSKAELERQVSAEYPEYRSPLVIGGRTG